MIKELILAIVLGTIVGIVATTIAKDKLIPKNNPIPTTSASPTINQQLSTTPVVASHFLTVSQPQNQTVSDTDTITIIGQTTANSQVIIYLQPQTFSLQADENGNFSQTVDLESGFNLIQINSFSPQQDQSSLDIQITYSTADF